MILEKVMRRGYPCCMESDERSSRGMPRWRERQRQLPVGEKIEMIGRFILETRRLEGIKQACKKSATSSSDLSGIAR